MKALKVIPIFTILLLLCTALANESLQSLQPSTTQSTSQPTTSQPDNKPVKQPSGSYWIDDPEDCTAW